MKKSIGKIICLVLSLVIVLLSGCASPTPTVSPTLTVSPVPPATATPTVKYWENKASLLIDSPIKYKSTGGWYTEEFPNSGITFNADTRWKFDIEVDDKSKEATGMMFYGYAANGDIQILGFFYQSGSWHLGYAPRNNEYRYWWDFDNLTSPKQSFILSISQDGKSMSVKNNEGFSEDAKFQVKLFDGAGIITTGFMSSPRVNIAISKLFIEQLQDKSALTNSAISLNNPYIVSFEDLDIAKATEISPFKFPEILDLVFFQGRDSWWARDGKFLSWAVDSRAHTGKYAVNAIPNGNPLTQYVLPVSMAILNPAFNTSGYDTVTLKMWINTTSNPKVKSIANCDSSLNVYSRVDSGTWTHKMALCGENVKESQGWQEISLDFDVLGKSTIQFAFMYEVQKVSTPDPSVYYLIDDLEITAATNQVSSENMTPTPTPSGYIIEQEVVVDANKEWIDSGILFQSPIFLVNGAPLLLIPGRKALIVLLHVKTVY